MDPENLEHAPPRIVSARAVVRHATVATMGGSVAHGSSETLPRSNEDLVRVAARPHLFVAFRADAPLESPSRHLLAGLNRVAIGRGERPAWQRDGRELDLFLPDSRASTTHALIRRVLHRWVLEDRGSRNGTLLNGKPIERSGLSSGDVIEIGRTFLIYRELAPADSGPDDAAGPMPLGLQTLSGPLAAEFDRLRRAARSVEPVLALGETGTGKELIARAVHEASGRTGPFVAVNCGALPEAMVEAELFGHKRGAFSGALASRAGLVREADGGTLFLDEIGDLRLSSQAALLRVLQECEVLPVGEDRPVPVNLRVVSATNRNLEALVEAGAFRADLLARLRGFVVRLPALRERREDLGIILAEVLRGRLGPCACNAGFSSATARALFLHGWPHNIRELDRVVGAALSLAGDGPIRLEHLPEAIAQAASPGATGAEIALMPAEILTTDSRASEQDVSEPSSLKAHKREQLIRLLTKHEGNVAAVARELRKGRTQILRWLKRYSIDPEHYRP